MKRVAAAVAVALALAASGSAATPHWKHWLCFPGSANDWCSVDLTTDVFGPNGSHRVVNVSVAANPPIDCFYLYPTVSEEYRPNALLRVDPEEREIAITQASQFSHVCRVYGPLFRQVTAHSGGTVPLVGTKIPEGNYAYEYDDISAAWRDYMAHWNGGRGVVLIGHSDGAFLFEDLLHKEWPSIRKVMISAIMLGGDVQVDAHNRYLGIPACTSTSQTGCIVAYSSWDRTPPGNGAFQSTGRGLHVLCVNPAAPGSNRAEPITPIFAGINPNGLAPYNSKWVTYHWVEFPHLYTARCVRQGSRAWLLVTRVRHSGDKRPTVFEALGADHGLHASDVNIALANLVSLVSSQTKAWEAHH